MILTETGCILAEMRRQVRDLARLLANGDLILARDTHSQLVDLLVVDLYDQLHAAGTYWQARDVLLHLARLLDQLEETLSGPSSKSSPRSTMTIVDLVIERPDVGPGWTTTLQAGDLVPPALADFPRRPAP